MKSIVDGEASIVFDESWEPVYIATWFGSATEKMIRFYFDWVGGIVTWRLRANEPFVIVTDGIDAARPSPAVRRLVTELTDALPEFERVDAGSYLVHSSALVRGAVTAMQWVSKRRYKAQPVSSCAEALRRGYGDLERASVRPPARTPESYLRPPRP
jgi:hypothetical protein